MAFLFLAALLLLPRTMPARAQARIIYVDAGATAGAGNGSSWAEAYTNLQDALAVAADGDEIWVAAGVYYPDEGSGQTDDARESTFQLLSGVAIYGGFAGGESEREQRDWEANLTILSGDIDQNDEVDGNSNNAYHVVTGPGTDDSVILDGLTITAGQADGSDSHDRGGGLYNNAGRPTLRNLSFSGNSADAVGGGMYNLEGSPTLTNVNFSGNGAGINAGGMFSHGGEPTLTNVNFSGNSAGINAGGMFNFLGSPTLTNVTFSGNSSDFNAGGMFSHGGEPTLTNVTFSGNTAYFSGGGMYNFAGADATLTNVTFSGNRAGDGGGGMYNFGSDSGNQTVVNIVNSIFWNNQDVSGTGTANASIVNFAGPSTTITHSLVQGWNPPGDGNLDGTDANNDPLFVTPVDPGDAPTTAGDLRLQLGSPAIDAGNNDALPAGLTTDLDGNARVADGDDDGTLTVDMGAYENQINDVSLVKSVTPASAGPGQPITYTLSYTNEGNTIATNVVITDVLPSQVANVTYHSSGAVITETTSAPYTWQVQDLAPGAGGVITLIGALDEAHATQEVITNTATISALHDEIAANNSSNVALFADDGRSRAYEMSRAIPDDCSQFSSSDVFSMSTLGVLQFREPPPPLFVEHGDGTASFTETLYRDDIEFEATFFFTRTTAIPSNAPAKLLSPSCYVENGGSIDPNTWAYYNISARLVGAPNSRYDGAVLVVPGAGRFLQMGEGASGRHVGPGLYTTFLWEVEQQGATPLISTGVATLLTALEPVLQPDALTIAKTVNNATPDEGETITYTVAVSNTDLIAASGVTVTDTLSGVLAEDITLAAGETVTYTYGWTADDGPQTVENVATVQSAHTNPMSDTVTVQVQNVPPALTAGPDQTVTLDNQVVVSATISDPGADAHTATVDWDDGGGEQAATVQDDTITASHTYTAAGAYTVTLCADDGDDRGCDTLTVTVVEAPPTEHLVYLPLFSAPPGLPDLVVEELSAGNDGVTVVIANAGESAVVEPFWVDVYIDPDSAPTQANQIWQMLSEEGLAWGVTDGALPLEPGQSLTLTIGDAYYVPEESNFGGALATGTPLYTQVDSAHTASDHGAVLEAHEADGAPYNNIAGPVTAAGMTVVSPLGEAVTGPRRVMLPPRPR